MKSIDINTVLNSKPYESKINIKGWIRNKRQSKNVGFLSINDGSTIKNLQAVFDPNSIDQEIQKRFTVGACISIDGTIIKSSGSQDIELSAETIDILGDASAEEYPLQPKKHSMEFLRSISHLRFRTTTFGSVFRVRNQISYAIHDFFYKKGFIYLNTPIITSMDAEGAGEVFHITSQDLAKYPLIDGKPDYSKDFFGKKTSLTVSGQLAGEMGAAGLGKIYTFGPTFRAENSNTTRHLAEFWMVEPEMAFVDLEGNIDLAEEFIKHIIQAVLYKCPNEMEFLNKRFVDNQKTKPQNERVEISLIEMLQKVKKTPFHRVTYCEAFSILKESKKNKKKKFAYLVDEWGLDFQSEHEKYLTDKHFDGPVVITNYPRKIKAFYMYQNEDDRTVAAMDVLIPGIGEIIGGSQREDRYDKLQEAMKAFNISEEEMKMYSDTRKFGSFPHSGFGLGLERMVQYITGIENIRDVIPFPRTPNSLDC